MKGALLRESGCLKFKFQNCLLPCSPKQWIHPLWTSGSPTEKSQAMKSDLADSMSDLIQTWREAEQHVLIHGHSFPWSIFQKTLLGWTAAWGVRTPQTASQGSLRDVYKATQINVITSIFLHVIARMSDREAGGHLTTSLYTRENRPHQRRGGRLSQGQLVAELSLDFKFLPACSVLSISLQLWQWGGQ